MEQRKALTIYVVGLLDVWDSHYWQVGNIQDDVPHLFRKSCKACYAVMVAGLMPGFLGSKSLGTIVSCFFFDLS